MIVPSLTDQMGGQSVLLKGPANLNVDIDQTFVKVKIEEREVPETMHVEKHVSFISVLYKRHSKSV